MLKVQHIRAARGTGLDWTERSGLKVQRCLDAWGTELAWYGLNCTD